MSLVRSILLFGRLFHLLLLRPRQLLRNPSSGSTIRLTSDGLLNPFMQSWIPDPIPYNWFGRVSLGTVISIPRVCDSLIGLTSTSDTLVCVAELPFASTIIPVPFGSRVVVELIGGHGLVAVRVVWGSGSKTVAESHRVDMYRVVGRRLK